MKGDRRFAFPPGGRFHLDTRRVRARCRCGCRRSFPAELLVSVNLDTDPGALEELGDDGLQPARCPHCGVVCKLAEALVLHDPARARLALFVPDALSHKELELRADLTAEIAAGDPSGLPDHAFDPAWLAGIQDLREWLFGPRARSIAPPAAEPEKRDEPPGQPVVDERSSKPPIHEAFADLRESDSGPPSTIPPPPALDDEDPIFDEDDDEDWLPNDLSESAPDTRPTPRPARPPSGDGVDYAGLLGADEEEEPDLELPDDEEEPGLEFEAGFSLSEPPARPDEKPKDAPRALLDGDPYLAELQGDEVVLHRVVDAEQAGAFDASRADLWFQLLEMEGRPLVAITLVEDPSLKDPVRVSWPLDVGRIAHRELAHSLRRSYSAQVRLYDEERSEIDRFEVSSDRELNVVAVLEEFSRKTAGHEVEETDFAYAAALLDRECAPLGEPLPGLFTAGSPPRLESFEDARGVLSVLESWSEPEHRAHLVLVRSFPLDYLEELSNEVLEAAVRYGAHIPACFRDRAIGLGLAASGEELALELVDGFNRTMLSEDRPDETSAAHNWRALLADCAEQGVTPDAETQDRAESLLEKHGLLDESAYREALEALSDPSQLETDQLLRMLRHRPLRLRALAAIAGRAEPQAWAEAVEAISRIGVAEMPAAVRAVAGLREAVAGPVAALLRSKRAHVRQAAAVLLGELTLRRTLMPLLKALDAERTPVRVELARAVARTGSTAIRSLERRLKDPRGDVESLALVVRLMRDCGDRAAGRFEAMASSGNERAGRLVELSESEATEVDPASPVERYGAILRRAAGGEEIPPGDLERLEAGYRSAVGERWAGGQPDSSPV
ncbi:MAG: CpXC domain-containing protein [Polyangia bacterium]